jgi:hypothetical protein
VKVGDLVRVKTKHYGTKLALVIGSYTYDIAFGVGWVVQPLDHPRSVICSSCDLEVISESR